MREAVIKVENLSKRYRIGARQKADTFANQLKNAITYPIKNLNRITSLSKFDDEDETVFWALKDINFEVKRGEVLGIIGHNGAGKSTLLKILSRIAEPTTGLIEIHGRVSALLEVGTGFHPELTGRDNIYMNGTILGMRKKEIDQKLEEIIDFSGVDKYIDTPVKFYSSGMRVRLAFSVAAHLEPEILIIDEVLAVGDAEFQKKCLGKMEDVAGQGRTVLFVSHNMDAIKRLCTRSLVLKSGTLVFSGESSQSINYYLDSEGYSAVNSSFFVNNNYIGRLLNGGIILQEFSTLFDDINPLSPFSLNIRFHLESEIDQLGIVVQFRKPNDEIIFKSSNMPICNTPIFGRKGDNLVELKITSLPLVEGTYYFDIGFSRERINGYFLIQKIGKFIVNQMNPYNGPTSKLEGIIVTSHQWVEKNQP